MKFSLRNGNNRGGWLTAALGCQGLFAWAVSAAALPVPELQQLRNRDDNHACSNATHPNPVVILHGLGATYYEDLNFLEAWLQQQGFCTFSLTYGSWPGFPFLGGLMPIATSAQQIAAFIHKTLTISGASKVDLVGHSEGAFQSLYVPKFEGVAGVVDKIVAIAPPTHGTNFANLYDLAFILGNVSTSLVGDLLSILGCPACSELVTGGPAITKLNDGKPIVQPGNTLTVIASKSDELVTPTYTAFVNETGVRNIYVQDTCPFDPVGHIGEAYDLNVWNLVLNALSSTPDRSFPCVIGSPG